MNKSAEVMSFGDALEQLKAGKKVARSGWNGKGMFLYLVLGSAFLVNRAPLLGIYPAGTEIDYRSHIDIKNADGSVSTWAPSIGDALADDWHVVEQLETHVDRMVREYDELRERCDKLADFISGEAVLHLTETQQELLKKQLNPMVEYMEILGQRITNETGDSTAA